MKNPNLNDHEFIELFCYVLDIKSNQRPKVISLLSKYGHDIHKIMGLTGTTLGDYCLTARQVNKLRYFKILFENVVVPKTRQIRSSLDIHDQFSNLIAHMEIETIVAVFLNRSNHVIHYDFFGNGCSNGTVCDTQGIYRTALDVRANSIILMHNHPRGQLKPSTADIQLTKELSHGCEVIKSKLFDHLIISSRGYFSFADEGFLNQSQSSSL